MKAVTNFQDLISQENIDLHLKLNCAIKALQYLDTAFEIAGADANEPTHIFIKDTLIQVSGETYGQK